MDDAILIDLLKDSGPWGIGLYIVFLLLTRLLPSRTRWSRRSMPNGRHESSSADESGTDSGDS